MIAVLAAIALVLTLWLLIATAAALVIGRIIRQADIPPMQIPDNADDTKEAAA